MAKAKITIEKEISVTAAVILVICGLVLLAFVIKFLLGLDITFRIVLCLFLSIVSAVLLIVFLVMKITDRSIYLSDFVIEDSTLTLLYSKGHKVAEEKRILSYDVESVRADISAYTSGRLKGPPVLNGSAMVVITLRDGNTISFEIPGYMDVYGSIFTMNANRAYLPGFSYEISADSESTYANAKHFIEHGTVRPVSRAAALKIIFIASALILFFTAITVWIIKSA